MDNYRKLTILNFFFAFSLALVASLIAPYLNKKGFSESQISIIFAVLPFTVFLFLPFLGRIADRVSRSLTILLGVFFEIVALFLYICSNHWLFIIFARFFDALAASLVTVIVIAKLLDGKLKTRGRNIGLTMSLGSFANMVAFNWSFFGR